MSNIISQKYIGDYITKHYGELRHDIKRMAKACRIVAKIYGYTPKQIFHFMIEQKPLEGTHSYGFNTRYGREIREEFEVQYHEMYKKITNYTQ
jgi:hypothetical protein